MGPHPLRFLGNENGGTFLDLGSHEGHCIKHDKDIVDAQIKDFGTPDAGAALEHFRSTGIRDGQGPNGNQS